MSTDPHTAHDYYDGGRLVRGTAPVGSGVSFADLGLSPCEGGHDYCWGECQRCGDLHPEDCVTCNALHGDPSHEDYVAPDTDDQED